MKRGREGRREGRHEERNKGGEAERRKKGVKGRSRGKVKCSHRVCGVLVVPFLTLARGPRWKQKTANCFGAKQGLELCLPRVSGKAATTVDEAWQGQGNLPISMSKAIYRFQ